MTGRQYPWILAPVSWSGCTQFIRGYHEGLPLLSWGIAPRDTLATYRQLRAMELRPGGADPVAVLYFHSRRGMRVVFANLYLISGAVPVRPMTEAKWVAVAAARLARCVCPTCPPDRRVKPYCLPTSVGRCWDCVRADEPGGRSDTDSGDGVLAA
jgi:hypothetical protein